MSATTFAPTAPTSAILNHVRASAGSVIRIRGLTKRFPVRGSFGTWLRRPLARRSTVVLDDVSLDVPRRGFFGLLGPNGAGKTTLFKILATLVLPDAGTVEVAGVDGVAHPGRVRGVLTPVIADERSLYWRLSGADNLRLYASLYGVHPAQRDARIRNLLDTVGLREAGDRMVGAYSSGMKQRLLIARALLSRPEVLLLDEPTRSLDPVTARDFRRFLREEVAGRQGCTVVLATHDADEAFELCGRLAVLDRGRLVATGTAGDLADLAGARRCRITVPSADATLALRVVQSAGLEAVTSEAGAEDGWVSLVGPCTEAAGQTAEINRTLHDAGVAVSRIGVEEPALAELIERLVAQASPRGDGKGAR